MSSSPFGASGLNESATSSASSSKAVLAALRSLQDKIRRLESERSQALSEATELRSQIKIQEQEQEHLKQRENLAAQKSLAEARTTHDRLLTEKTEMEVRVARMEDRNRECHCTAEELQSKMRALEEEKTRSMLGIKDLESQHRLLEGQIQNMQQKENDLAQTMVHETKRHEEEMASLSHRLQQLQDELQSACQTKGSHDMKLQELDQLVGQLLVLNESFVRQLTGRESSSTGRSGKTKKTAFVVPKKSGAASGGGGGGGGGKRPKAVKQKKKSLKHVVDMMMKNPASGHVFVPRVANETTVATERSRVPKFVDSEIAKRLANPATQKTSHDMKSLKKMHKMYAEIAKEYGEEEKGDRRSSSSKSTTRLANKKQASSQLLTSRSEGDVDMNRLFGAGGKKPGSRSSLAFADQLKYRSEGEDFGKIKGLWVDDEQDNSDWALSSSSAAKQGQGSPTSSNMHSIITSLEKEFDHLDSEYHSLLLGAGSDAGSHNAENVLKVMRKLHAKGNQLRKIRSPE